MNRQIEELYNKLIENIITYYPSADLSVVREAFTAADRAHEGQLRKSGEAYMIHPLNVAIILSELKLDKESIAASLLHDVVEDTEDTIEDIAEMFGGEIAFLVQGVTKLGQLPYTTNKLESQAENFRKMFLAMAKDIRVILIKLADRLHNMRTLKYQSPEKQKEISRETLDIYAPIAQRLGISMFSMELEDLSLKYLYPDIYYDLAKRVELTRTERQQYIDQMIDKIKAALQESQVDAVVSGRFKHFFSIYRKMVNRSKTLDDMYDLFAIRIIVETIKECYAVLGMIHELFRPIPGRFKDYISMPKSNMYRSLHTTVFDTNGQSFEIQIRTREMHRTAEYGIAAHWKYKEGKTEGLILNREEERLNWLKQLLEWQQEMSDNSEFMNLVKNDFNLMSEDIYCFTPQGDVKNLPKGANVIDFAYSIHSAVGNKMVGARVNGDLVPLDYVIRNGDRIEINTSQNSKGPSPDWLALVKSAQARNKINQWFREANREDNIKKGKELLQSYCEGLSISCDFLRKEEYRETVMRKYGYRDWDSVLAAVGHGGLKESQIVNKFLAASEPQSGMRKEEERRGREEKKTRQDKTNTGNVIIDGGFKSVGEIIGREIGGGSRIAGGESERESGAGSGSREYVRFSKCCNPVPGDEIVAFITKGRGITIHRTDCVNMIQLPVTERGRLLEAEWNLGQEEAGESYLAEIQILAGNRLGMLEDVSGMLEEAQISVKAMDCKLQKQGLATLNVSFEVTDRESLDELVKKLMQIEGVVEIRRTNG